MKLTDALGNEVGYLPISLRAGEVSEVITLILTPDAPGERLRSDPSSVAIIAGRIAGAGAYLDLSIVPIDLTPYVFGYCMVEVKIEASIDVAGLARTAQFLGVAAGGAAGWTI